MSKQRIILLTGPPGCGKTTLVKKVCDDLRRKNLSLKGFFTEEIRNGRERVGFDVVLLDGSGKRAPLSRIHSGRCTGPMVGKYAVDIKSFESCVLPIFNLEDEDSILVLDEIGKMELFSEKFKGLVSKLLNCERGLTLATVPVQTTRAIPLVEMIKEHPDAYLITVTRDNRNLLLDKVVDLIMSGVEKKTTAEI